MIVVQNAYVARLQTKWEDIWIKAWAEEGIYLGGGHSVERGQPVFKEAAHQAFLKMPRLLWLELSEQEGDS